MTTEYITYNIKDVTDFYKQLDDNSLDGVEDDTNLCLISQQPLEEQHVTLVCGHRFNYDPLFKDVYNHKKKHYTLDTMRLRDYQIRCPYCRNIQNQLIPYCPGKDKVHGVNCLTNMNNEMYLPMKFPSMYHIHYKNYAKGYCCHDIDDIQEMINNPQHLVKCVDTTVIYNQIDERVYCKKHLKQVNDQYFKSETAAISKNILSNTSELNRLKQLEKKIQAEKNKLLTKLNTLEMTSKSLKNRKEQANMVCKKKATNKNSGQPLLENVILSSYDPNTGDSVYTLPQNELSTPSKVRPQCIAFTNSSKDSKPCKCKSVKGSVYCTRHKNIFGM